MVLGVAPALDILSFNPRKAAGILLKLLQSAIANAENNNGLDSDQLRVQNIQVNEGITFKRMKPRARGRADRVFKRNCHITLHLGSGK